MTNIKHIDQLSEFHLRDLKRLTPGAKVLFGHVPPLDEDPAYCDTTEYADAYRAEVIEVKAASFNELHHFTHTPEWATAKQQVIFYDSVNYKNRHRYASDSGVIPSTVGEESYNPTNFTVLLEDLEAAGVTLDLNVSEEYQARLDEFNARVVVREDNDVYYGD